MCSGKFERTKYENGRRERRVAKNKRAIAL